MKKFNWRLQRILELKEKQEHLARTELMEITEKIIAIRHAILLRQTNLRQSLAEFGRIEVAQRLPSHELMMRSAKYVGEQISLLRKKMTEFEEVKKQKMEKMLELRKFRKNLEKLRQAAYLQYQEDVKKAQLSELDEIAAIATARQLIAVESDSTGDRT
ncbi:MAG: hypothetical protein A2Y07_09185 [Planctomycetes bacterium GWF2_50_10]|nr:MAG: hypothetical protein A2Y07_09185 [Planctomycetes bacterium GWF2_50_10]